MAIVREHTVVTLETASKRLSSVSNTINLAPLFGALITLLVAVGCKDLGFAHQRVVQEPAALAILPTVLTSVVEPGFFALQGHITFLVAADLVLSVIVGFRYDEALK
ncbi:hypothetical protein B0T16DRAFT_490523 [Cercophora newfieldiana]|uniref:Uncharacterized protein n=1 Tax=Cercophora newfieldiana TaxID=92897 RepID=A0AA39YJH9_9PEZI|nr:hypothetical protein B0T16DRAFT_490523 [Cercophora newfieldiana]